MAIEHDIHHCDNVGPRRNRVNKIHMGPKRYHISTHKVVGGGKIKVKYSPTDQNQPLKFCHVCIWAVFQWLQRLQMVGPYGSVTHFGELN
jgi:hypothetical protein